MLCFVKIVAWNPGEGHDTYLIQRGQLSEHEGERISVDVGVVGYSVSDLGGFVSGKLLALVSDSVATFDPVGLDSRRGILVGLRLASLEAEATGRSFSTDNLGLSNLSNEDGLSEGIEAERDDLGKNVVSFELDIDSIVEVSDVHFAHDSVVSVVIIDGEGHLVVINEERDALHAEEEEGTHNPNDD